jgi:hypothetical protein
MKKQSKKESHVPSIQILGKFAITLQIGRTSDSSRFPEPMIMIITIIEIYTY